MRRFSWVLDRTLGGMGWPGEGRVLTACAQELHGLGVGLVVTLTEQPVDSAPFADAGIENLHLPTSDFAAPSPTALARFVAETDTTLERGRAVVVHCAVGIGRTGTCLAVYLTHRGLDPDAAIDEVRRLRPGSLESVAQCNAVRRFATPSSS